MMIHPLESSLAATELRAPVSIPATMACTALGRLLRTASVLPMVWSPRLPLIESILTIGTFPTDVPFIVPSMWVPWLIVIRALLGLPSTVVGRRVPTLTLSECGHCPMMPVRAMLGTPPSRESIPLVEIRNSDPLDRRPVTLSILPLSIYLPLLSMSTREALKWNMDENNRS